MRSTLAIVLGAAIAATLISSARADISLGTAANFTLLSVPGNSDWQLTKTTVTGNVGLGTGATISISGDSSVSGTIYVSTGSGQVTGTGTIVTNSTVVTQAITDALAADTAIQALTSTQTSGAITASKTFTANAVNHINVLDITGDINASVTLSGTANDFFIVRATGKLNLGGGESILVSGGLLADHVIIDFTGSGKTLTTSTTSEVDGTILAFGCSGTNVNGTFTNIYGGNGGTIKFANTTSITNDPFVGIVPEPAALGLLAIGSLAVLTRRRRA